MNDLPLKRRGTRSLQLAALRRDDGSELRVDWIEGQNTRFLSVRISTPTSEEDVWLPDRKHRVSIGTRELHDFADAVNRAVALLEARENSGGDR